MTALASWTAVAVADGSVTVVLREQNASGVVGAALLSPAGDRTVVGLVVRGAPGGMPAHVHRGRCRGLDPSPLFPLTDARSGTVTTTVVDASLGELRGGAYAIVVHRPAEDLSQLLDPVSIVACGDLGGRRGRAPVGLVTALPDTGSGAAGRPAAGGSWLAARVTLALAGLTVLAVGVGLRRTGDRARERPF